MAGRKTTRKEPRVPLKERFHISEKTSANIRKFLGLVLAGFAIYTLVSVISYLFTWTADQSGGEFTNLGASTGYRWGHFLVGNCFGLGNIFLVAWLFVAAVRMFFLKISFRIGKITILAFTLAIISSLAFSYISGLFTEDLFFDGGLGGECGATTVKWLTGLIGSIATGILIFLLIVLWLLCTSRRFSDWFMGVGEKDRREDEPADVHVPEDFEDDIPVLVPDYYQESIAEDVNSGRKRLPAGKKDSPVEPVADKGGIEVVTDDLLKTKVTEELPRIDVREDLSYYNFPSLDLLGDYASSRHEVSQEELNRNNNKIRATLRNYKIEVERVVAQPGPTVTLYKVTPAPGVKISAIRNREEDIAMALGAKGVRVVNLPDSVGIEVANDRPSTVPLKSVMNDDEFRNSTAELPVAIGYTITQKVKVFDLANEPHLLVAGATKQGKSVGLNVIISSLLYSKHPSELKFVFIDPKMVEFNAYAGLYKHYLAVLPTAANEEEERSSAIVKQPKQAEEILRSLCQEMDERYLLMSKTSANNIKLYNEKFRDRHLLPTAGHRYLPYIVTVVDEYADLVMSGGMGAESKNISRSIQSSIIRLAQKGRAAGIHLIIATQRPSVDVITGVIKANFPTRIAFRVFSSIDSNTILGTSGAEKLIGNGDMLYYAGGEPERVQCAYVSMDEIGKITDSISSQTGYRQCYNTPYYLPEPESNDSSGSGSGKMIDMNEIDEQFEDAARTVVQYQQGSTSYLQRKLGMGYARAGKVMDQLEAAGIVGPQMGSKPREVLVGDFNELQPILDSFLSK